MRFSHRGFRVGVFVDNVNLHVACREHFGGTLNHALLLKRAVDDNELFRAIAYGVRLGDGIDRWRVALEKFGYEIKEKPPKDHKADWDAAIVVDVWRIVNQVDMVVIVSGDGDFVPLVKHCQDLGRIVKVMGVLGCTAQALIEAADEFVPVTEELLLKPKKEEAD